jgi:hypothetical protein
LIVANPRRPVEWLGTGALQKVVLVVTSAVAKEVVERWAFDIQTDKAAVAGDGCAATLAARPAAPGCRGRATLSGAPPAAPHARCRPAQQKSEAQITQEIQAIIRQITASVTFLPLLTDTCAPRGAAPPRRRHRGVLTAHAEATLPALLPQAPSTCWPTPTKSPTSLSSGAPAAAAPAPPCDAAPPPPHQCTPPPHAAALRREESDPRYITGAADVKLRAFSTSVHSVEALVSYKAE